MVHRQKGHRQKGFQTKMPKITDKKAKKADKRAKNQSYILIVFSLKKMFFQCNKTDVELDLFEVFVLLRSLRQVAT